MYQYQFDDIYTNIFMKLENFCSIVLSYRHNFISLNKIVALQILTAYKLLLLQLDLTTMSCSM